MRNLLETCALSYSHVMEHSLDYDTKGAADVQLYAWICRWRPSSDQALKEVWRKGVGWRLEAGLRRLKTSSISFLGPMYSMFILSDGFEGTGKTSCTARFR